MPTLALLPPAARGNARVALRAREASNG